MKIFRLGELFSGPGGIGLGASRAKVETNTGLYAIDHAWATDYDEDTCTTYRKNLSPTEPERVICADIRTLPLDQLAPIEALAFGFPCNDFSVVGEKRGLDGTYGPLYTYGVKIINRFHPQWFVAENVSGLQNSNEGLAFRKILTDLTNAGDGYRLVVHKYKFEEYGVPQARHRIIIVGIKQELNLEFRIPAPTHLKKYVTAREALEVPPIPKHAPNQEKTKQSPMVIERLKYIRPGENAWSESIPQHLRLNVKGAKMSQIYRRLDPNKPAYTITGSGGGGTHTYHWKENRALTNRERARLQTFPDNYEFSGSKESVRKQIGMAVPPLGAQIFFEAILKTFAGIPYEYVLPHWSEDELPPQKQLQLLDSLQPYDF